MLKIGAELRSGLDSKERRPLTEGRPEFDRLVRSEVQRLKQDGLEKLVDEIEKQGEKVAQYRTFREVAKFKRMVKGFLQDTVSKGLHLEKSTSFSMSGDHRTLALVKEVDEKLIELTEQVMDQERTSVDLLGMIGEIKGLLVNIYL